MSEKLVIASTRLPISVTKQDGKFVYTPSAGGLATGVASIKKSSDSVWVGWPGIASDDLTRKDKEEITRELKKHGCHPVFLTQKQIDTFYTGYSNSTLWPLFHYFPHRARYTNSFWVGYQEANKLFAKETLKFSTPGARLWVHDYQLMLLPQLLRAKQKSAVIGFFLHTPFPSFEIFRLFPEREALLKGLLGANLIGFHTYDYVRHFLSSVQRILGYENSLGTIRFKNRLIQTDAFPIGIDYKKFAKGPKTRNVRRLLKSFDLFSVKTKVILSVDRADYSKGIPARLNAFEMFLKKNPDQLGKVVFVLLAVPTRSEVNSYKELRTTIEQKVSRINGDYATVDWSPIIYRYQNLSFEETCALYAMADVMLITPHRDGMNLVAKEYVATKHKDQKGVLILSEMAGAAAELPEAVLVNPNNAMQVAAALSTALHMPKSEQKKRLQKMQSRISEYSIERWAHDFLQELSNSAAKQSKSPKYLHERRMRDLLKAYKQAKNRLILLDYDGTLKDFVNSPDEKLVSPTLHEKQLIKKLTDDTRNKVFIISGRLKTSLGSFFGNKDLGLIAEHGGWIFDGGRWLKSKATSRKWKKIAKPILEETTARTPGSEVEEKDFSLVWHYRRVSPDLAFVRKEELKNHLYNAEGMENIGVFEGQKIIEVKPESMHKGAQATELISTKTWDFILAIGDDYTDEDMFETLPDRSYTINVGNQETRARYQLEDVKDVIRLISKLTRN